MFLYKYKLIDKSHTIINNQEVHCYQIELKFYVSYKVKISLKNIHIQITSSLKFIGTVFETLKAIGIIFK